MLESVRIVLVNTSHPGNIGGVARAMKNMGVEQLVLVEPKEFPSEKATARSSGATDILESARVVDTLDQALEGCNYVVGASARGRHIPWPVVDPRTLVEDIVPQTEQLQVALVFGREDRGLTNEELHRCNRHVHIPSNPDFSSLNLAAAVQVLCYELRMQVLRQQRNPTEEQPRWGTEWDIELASADELQLLFEHMEQALVDIDFLDPNNPRQLMTRLRRLYLRSHPDKVEVNVLRGILTATQKLLDKQN
ncbi:MAG: RNA methyltransferase [Motiliproteus sp.]|nr:RNA methyltransferase [Motiliproteus sp.]MCW9053206.1 RNA methyltransferase [Motiliproteus sp.]